MKQDSVYFDSHCSLCSKEIRLWQKLSADKFDFKDIHQQQQLTNKQQAEMLKLLHIQCSDGRWLIGLDANFRLWRSHPIGWISYLFSIPGVYQLTRHIYNTWADRRYRKKYDCDSCSL